MLTIFGLPKAFTGQFQTVQENAIRSWSRLKPSPEIILFGNDSGTAEMAREIGARHEPGVERNEYDTPLVTRIFERAQQIASNDLMCYVNSDIILTSSFSLGVSRLVDHYGKDQFLGVGRKCNFPLTESLPFDGEWEQLLQTRAARDGAYVTYDSDYFVFRRGLWADMPPFAIGRCYWTQWLMFKARQAGVPMIDMTPVVLAVESKHDYSHAKSTGHSKRLSGIEYETNRQLFKGCRYYTTVNASAVLTTESVERAPVTNHLLSASVRGEYFVYFLLKGTLYPYSLPLIVLGRWAATALRALRSVPRRFGNRAA